MNEEIDRLVEEIYEQDKKYFDSMSSEEANRELYTLAENAYNEQKTLESLPY